MVAWEPKTGPSTGRPQIGQNLTAKQASDCDKAPREVCGIDCPFFVHYQVILNSTAWILDKPGLEVPSSAEAGTIMLLQTSSKPGLREPSSAEIAEVTTCSEKIAA
jgi:hypothetical protein